MAKKKNNLTLEEKLKNALVPEEEQPYQIPENWVWTRLGEVVVIYRGVSYKKNNVHSMKLDNDCLILRGGNIVEGGITIDSSDNVYIDKSLVKKHQFLQKYDVVIVSSTGSIKVIGRAGVSLDNYSDISFGAFLTLIRSNNYMNKRYISYFFQSDLYRLRIQSLANGININNIKNNYIKDVICPLPPIHEQQRIVERIESLFSKLDEAKEKIQMSLDSFENRKSAILYQAFSGELTKKWREENGVKFDDWEESTIENYATTKYGYTESANFQEIGPKYLRITDIKNGKVDWNMVPYCDISEENYRKYKLEKFDIVVARTGATTGKSYLILEDVKAVYASYLIKIEIDKVELLTPQFLYLFLQTQSYWNQIIDLSSGIAQPGVNANKLKTINITVPPLEEQKEIVRILDNLFEKEQGTQELIDLIENIDLMKKSILARAFRGELGTNIPEEESAIELLKSVLEV